MAESTIKITAETKQAESSLESLGEKVKQADEKFIGLGEAIGAIGAAAVAGGLTELLKSSLETADSMGKMAQKAGVSVESLSRLSVAAQLSDVDTQSLASAMGKLDKNMVSAQSGTGAAAEAFAALGISITDSNGKLKSSDQVMAEVADRFSKTGDGAGKTAAAMAIFGKAGADLIPMLNSGSEELDRFGKLADQLGLTLDGETAQSAQDVNDRFAIMGLAAKGVGMQIMEQMLPTFDSLSQVLVDTATDTDGLKAAADTLAFALKGIVTIGMGAARTFEAVGTELGGLSAAAVAIVHGDVAESKKILAELDKDQQEADAKFNARLEKLWAASEKKPSGAAKEDKPQVNMKSEMPAAVDPNEAAVLQLQNDEFRKQMELLGVAAEQVKVYELAMKGATQAQLEQAQAAANGTMAAEASIKAKKDEEAADKVAAKSSYELSKAREATLASMTDLHLQEQLRQADLKTGIEREQAVSAVHLQIVTTNITKEHDQKVKALNEKRRLEAEDHALSIEHEQEYKDQLALLDAEYEARITDAKRAEEEKRQKNELSTANFIKNVRKGDYENAISIAEQMSAGLATHSRAMFEINKAAATAEAIIHTYSAAMKAYDEAGGGWSGAAAAAISIAYGLVQVSQIQSTQFGGGGGGVSAASAGGGIPSLSTTPGTPVNVQSAPVQGTAAAPTRTVNISMEGGTQFYSAESIRNQLIPALNDAVGDGVVINVGSR